MVHTSTKENETYNLKSCNNARALKSSTVVNFEDTKCRVVSLIKKLTAITNFINSSYEVRDLFVAFNRVLAYKLP